MSQERYERYIRDLGMMTVGAFGALIWLCWMQLGR